VDAIVWVAIIQGVFGVLLLWLGDRLRRAVKDQGMKVDDANAKLEANNGTLERVRNQVENDHETNLREESDARHGENQSRLTRLEKLLRTNVRETRALRYKLEDHVGEGNDRERRLRLVEADLEITQPTRPTAETETEGTTYE
jgi:hypothetical protein